MPHWDPTQYERYDALRSRPFDDLLARLPASSPSLVIDLGCGNGTATLTMARHWPGARIVGVDSSPDMLARARERDQLGRVEWVQEDVTRWDPSGVGVPDVIVTNATLQWVPGHLDLIPRWLEMLAPGGTFAMQVPGNFDAPSHRIIREVAAAQERDGELTSRLRHGHPVGEPQEYAEALATACPHLDVWETTYLQVLEGEHPVLEWVKGTALRPLLEVLEGDERDTFLSRLADRLEEAYPRQGYGTPFPFRRIFAIGTTPADHSFEASPAPIGVTGLDHVQVACPAGSEDTLRAFYGDVLGLPEVAKPPALAARGGCWFQVGPQQLHLGVEEGFAPARKAHPCLLVADVDTAAAAVSTAGAPVRWDDQIVGIRRFHTDDPCGNRLEIQQTG